MIVTTTRPKLHVDYVSAVLEDIGDTLHSLLLHRGREMHPEAYAFALEMLGQGRAAHGAQVVEEIRLEQVADELRDGAHASTPDDEPDAPAVDGPQTVAVVGMAEVRARLARRAELAAYGRGHDAEVKAGHHQEAPAALPEETATVSVTVEEPRTWIYAGKPLLVSVSRPVDGAPGDVCLEGAVVVSSGTALDLDVVAFPMRHVLREKAAKAAGWVT